MHKWHDLTGAATLLCCLCVVWALAIALGQSETKHAPDNVGDAFVIGAPSKSGAPPVGSPAIEQHAPRTLRGFVVGLAIWLVIVEAGTEAWYRLHENAQATPVYWTIRWPRDNASLRELPLSYPARAALRFDEGQRVTWIDTEGLRWQVLYLRWLPRRVWVQLVSDHSPSVCLPASGRELLPVRQLEPLSIHGIEFQPRTYKFMENGRAVYTFYAVWEDRTTRQRPVLDGVTVNDRFKSVRDGRRNPGQRILELSVWGMEEIDRAEAALTRQLEAIVSAPGDAGVRPNVAPTSDFLGL
jgi:hypothetical protein